MSSSATWSTWPTKIAASVYAEEMKIAAKLMDWKAKWHPHGKGEKRGSVVTGLGMAMHTWGGGGHPSTCLVKIHPDGGVETFLGSQDLGTGTRTVIAIVLAETFGLPIDAVKVNIGSSKYPASRTLGRQHHGGRRVGVDAAARGSMPWRNCARKWPRSSASGRVTRRQGRPHLVQRRRRQESQLERGVQPARHGPAGSHGPRPAGTQLEAFQLGRRRRANGRSGSRPRNWRSEDEEIRRRAGHGPGRQSQDGRQPDLRRDDHGHRLRAVRRAASWIARPAHS